MITIQRLVDDPAVADVALVVTAASAGGGGSATPAPSTLYFFLTASMARAVARREDADVALV